ncbi:MAG: 4-hydroxy-tetrahydrodipicolinate synthase, partial [Colwellia sp.]
KALTKVQREQGLALLANIAKDELVGDKLMLMADDDFQYCC